MMNMHTRLEHGLMIKKANKYLAIILATIGIFNTSTCLAIEETSQKDINPIQISIQDYITLNTAPKYTENFTNFSFVNPDAPKKGRIVLPAYGTFDNFNPYIFKGTASTEAVALTLDSLGVSPADDIETVYPLIAEKFELPSDKSFIGFFINPKAKFSDGSPITADDVVFSFNSLITKGSPIYKFY